MKIAFEVQDSEYYNMDFTNPSLGNPGIGGTPYAMLMLAYSYTKYCQDHKNEIYVIHEEPSNEFWDMAQTIILKGEKEIEDILKKIQVEIYVAAGGLHSEEWYTIFEKNKTSIVYVLENFISREWLQQFKQYDIIKRVVFVGQEQYDRCIDDDIMEKASVIGNIINNNHDKYRDIKDVSHNVTYMGALLPQKGFHLLAKQWKMILKKVPDAQLYVIGTGQLYDEKTQLGSLGISTESYERIFVPYLQDETGEFLNSVHFMGIMGREKEELFLKTAVGIPNPSAETETFCNSAVEMQGYGIPIVTRAKNSFFDVIDNHRSGLLFYTEWGFRCKVVKLLLDQKKNELMGKNARNNSNQFTADILIPKWQELFEEVQNRKSAQFVFNPRHIFYNAKFLRIINRFLRIRLHFRCLPSFAEGISTGLKRRK